MSHSLAVSLRLTELAVVAWCVVAVSVSLARPLSAGARVRLLSGATSLALAAVSCGLMPAAGAFEAVRNVLPALFVLAAYWVAGMFFVAPQPVLEQRLLAIDRRALALFGLTDAPTLGRHGLRDVLEAAYFAVYAVLPLGAWSAWSYGGAAAVDRYWTLVFLAESSCYLALAWLQTRPPRVLESSLAAGPPSFVRRANELVLTHGSIQVNTLPSGHAAGAVAVWLALTSVGSPHALLFGVVALGICVATVVGRYHFLVDTVAGAGVAAVWWWLLRGWLS